MRPTDIKTFREALVRTGAYHTSDENRAAKRARSSAWLTARFSFSVTRIFPLCALYQAVGCLRPEHWSTFCFSAVTMPEKCGMRVDIDGWAARVAHKGPVVYVSNHRSTLDTVLLPTILTAFGPFHAVTKASLAHLPFLEKAAVTMGILPIGRKSPREDLLALFDGGRRCIDAGHSILVFPQGTRQDVFGRDRFSSIGAKLAEKAGVPVVPVAVDTRCMPVRTTGVLAKVFHDFGTVDPSRDIRVLAGPVLTGKAREMQEQSFDWIASTLSGWGLPVERERLRG